MPFCGRPSSAHDLTVITDRPIDRIVLDGEVARRVILTDGSELTAIKGIILSAGSIGSAAILLRSGIGPADQLKTHGIEMVARSDEVGENLHDHPGAGLHFAGPGSGYGITLAQAPAWALAPVRYLLSGTGRLASPTVEGGAFFNARDDGGPPDVQSHFIPFMLGWKGARVTLGAGYFADVCVCRPKSRGALRLASADPGAMPEIDLGLFNDTSDLDTLVAGLGRLRSLLDEADLGPHRAPEAYPGLSVSGEAALRDHVIRRCGTAYHPVGTLRIGEGTAPVSPRLAVRGVKNLWVADASIMPSVTSANTNAPAMMIGYRAAEFVAEDAA